MELLTKESNKPYGNESLNKMYDLLFCDNIDLYKSATQSADYPWGSLLAETPDMTQLNAVATDQTLEARQRMLAYHVLSANGHPIHQKELLGVIIEVGVADGLDVVAAFSDGTARYINYSGKVLIWDTQTTESNQLINQLFTASDYVVQRIGRWDGERRPFPAKGMIRLNFLVSDGLYFGEGPFDTLYADAMGEPVITAAIKLMTYLTHYGA